jgi:septum formation topological specificity factor MinE
MRVYERSDEVNEALLEKLYEDALENLQKYKSLSDEEKEEIALETAEELFAEMSV